MSFTIFQNRKTLFQAIITKSSKSRNIDIFPKGLTHGFCSKIAIFPSWFFQAIEAMKMSFTKFENKKTPFQAIITRSSKARNIDFFSKVLTHGFGPKMAIFPSLFFEVIQPRKMSFTILQKKNAFLGYKNKKFKRSKNSHFSKGVKPWFWSKNGHFSKFRF